MKESFSTQEAAHDYASEGELLVNDLLEKNGLTREEYQKLSHNQKSAIVGEIRQILKEPEVQSVLTGREHGGLSAEESQKIREVVGVEKWNKLSEFVSYVKTLVGEEPLEKRVEKYSEHLAFGVDANEIKHTLSHIYDVCPARIDTDIKHQSSLFYRAVVEVASNALDASVKDRSPIGRFGIGFYQILNHLNNPDDRVTVTTKKAGSLESIKIEFRRKGEEDVDFKVTHEKADPEVSGTKVELKSKEFEATKGEEIIRQYFSHTQDVDLYINGGQIEKWKPQNIEEKDKKAPRVDVTFEDGKCTVSDSGIGMDERVVFEKLLVPKLSDKPPVYELREKGVLAPKLYYSTNTEDKGTCKVVTQVGGIMVEETKAEGVNMADTVVLDLPPSTILGEQRNEIEINKDTIDAVKKIVDDAVRLPRPDCFKVINSLAPVIKDVQNRSRLFNEDDNAFIYFQQQVRERFPDVYFLPSKPAFLNLELPVDHVLLNEAVHQSSVKSVPAFSDVKNWHSNSNTLLLKAKFKAENTESIIVDDRYIVIDDRVDVNNPDNATFIELAIKNAAGYNKGELGRSLHVESVERKDQSRENFEHKDLVSCVKDRWYELGFKDVNVAVRQAEIFTKTRPEVSRVFTEQILNKIGFGHDVIPLWSVLQDYVYSDRRQDDEISAEIVELAGSIGVLINQPNIDRVAKENKIPIVSKFEECNGGMARHIRDKIEGNNRSNTKIVFVGGKKYYGFSETDYEAHGMGSERNFYMAENGSVVEIGKKNILFKDENITVFAEKIVNTKTGRKINPKLPLNVEWGEIKRDEAKSQYFFASASHVFDQYYDRDKKSEEKEKFVIDKEGRRYEVIGEQLFINGVEVKTIGEYKNENIKQVFVTTSGEIRIYGSKIDAVDMPHEKGEYRSKVDYRGESAFILDADGKEIWKFDETKWGEKIYISPGFNYEMHHVEDNRKSQSRCVPIVETTNVVDDNEPLIRIARYDFVGSGRVRETLGYVDALGKVTDVNNTDVVNNITLRAKYAWEGSCNCCGLDVPFSTHYDPFDKEGNSVIKNLVKIPVIIESDFIFDEAHKQWFALARKTTRTDESRNDSYHIAVFDDKGVFLRTEEIGEKPRIFPEGFDFRNLKSYLAGRIPSRFETAIGFDDKDPQSVIDRLVEYKDQDVYINRGSKGQYGFNFETIARESSRVGDRLLEKKGDLDAEHATILNDFVSQFSVPDREKLERLFYRVLQHRNVSAEKMKPFLKTFYELDYIDPAIMSSECVDVLSQVNYLDSERFVQLIKMMNGSMPSDSDKRSLVASKFVKFYGEKLQSESMDYVQNLLSELNEVHVYKNAKRCDGHTLIKYGIEVPQHEIPKSIRPLILFLMKSDVELAANEISDLFVEPESGTEKVLLSQVIQWKRLQESEAREFSGDTKELGEQITEISQGKNREHIVREITHAIHFQALNSTELYVRELIQNAVDAMQQADMEQGSRKVGVRVTTDGKHEIATHFSDPVGMDLRTVLNYFLVPGESTKLKGGYIGFYGQGVYTLFKDCKEVCLKTGTGNGGGAHYLKMKPVIEHGMISDVEIHFWNTDEKFKGTTLTKIQEAKNPYVEAAYVRNAITTLTSALSSERAQISFQNESINAKYQALATKEVGKLGTLTVYKNTNNIITQHGLYVKDISDEYLGLVPGFMGNNLKEWGGLAIDLPRGIELTRSRQDIANKDKIEQTLDPAVQEALVSSYLESVKEKIEAGEDVFPYDQLPYDYFAEGFRYDVPAGYREDVQALVEGKPLAHIKEYKEGNNAVKFMTLLPILEVKKKRLSIDDLRSAFRSEQFPFDQKDWYQSLPRKLVQKLEQQREMREEQRRAEASKESEKNISDCSLEEIIGKADDELKKWLVENKPKLERLAEISKSFVSVIDPVLRKQEKTGTYFYNNNNQSIAHASRGGSLAWNIGNMQRYSYSSPIEEIKGYEEKKKIKSLNQTLGTLAHEYGHVLESFEDWTHDPKHDLEQARILIQYVINGGVEKLLDILNSK